MYERVLDIRTSGLSDGLPRAFFEILAMAGCDMLRPGVANGEKGAGKAVRINLDACLEAIIVDEEEAGICETEP